MGEFFTPVHVVILLVVFLPLYFLPAIIASARGAVNALGIDALNLFLGWTGLGWLVALIWAMSAETKAQVKAKEIDYAKLAAAMGVRRDQPPPH